MAEIMAMQSPKAGQQVCWVQITVEGSAACYMECL